MVVYIAYGFRWPRIGQNTAPGIRAHIVSYNILDAAAEYLQEPATAKAVLQSFKRIDPNIPYHLPTLQIIEQYDPDDISNGALSQPFAFIVTNVIPIADNSQPPANRTLSLNIEDVMNNGPDLPPVGVEALERLRTFLSPSEKTGWWVVYNGDPERAFPESEDESEDDNDVESGRDGGSSNNSEKAPRPPVPAKPISYRETTFRKR